VYALGTHRPPKAHYVNRPAARSENTKNPIVTDGKLGLYARVGIVFTRKTVRPIVSVRQKSSQGCPLPVHERLYGSDGTRERPAFSTRTPVGNYTVFAQERIKYPFRARPKRIHYSTGGVGVFRLFSTLVR